MKEEELTFCNKEYPSYEEREDIKRRASKGIAKGNDRQKVHCYLHGLIFAHYWRAREHLEDNPKFAKKVLRSMYKYYGGENELDIDKYTNHWLYANGHDLSSEVLKIIKDEWGYKPVENKYLPKGASSYREM